jgi:hypothetical protein
MSLPALTATSSCVMPAVMSNFPSGLSASACGLMPGSSICLPAGVTIGLAGVMGVSPLRPTGAVVAAKSPAKMAPELKPAHAAG